MLPLAKRKAGTPLSEEERQQRRDAAKSRWANAAKVGAAVATVVGAPLVIAGSIYSGNRAIANLAFRNSRNATTRGTTHLGLKDLWRARGQLGDHLRDMWNNPTAVGKTPSRKEIRRQFARSSFWGNERVIATGDGGKVIVNTAGGPTAVQLSPDDMINLRYAANGYRNLRVMHNHPLDSPPSLSDMKMAMGLNAQRHGAGKSPASNVVYSYGNDKITGKTRVRVTRHDEMPLVHRVSRKVEAGADPIQAWKEDVNSLENFSEQEFISSSKGPFWRIHPSDPKKNSEMNGAFRYRTKAVSKAHAGLPMAKGVLI